jgi:mRNA-degrading endonuclease RelE of RelBE toxin-antitoxin system
MNNNRKNIWNKINEVANSLELNPDHYKNLTAPLQAYKRVHVNKSYVILFKVNIDKKIVTFHKYDHHDKIYNRK